MGIRRIRGRIRASLTKGQKCPGWKKEDSIVAQHIFPAEERSWFPTQEKECATLHFKMGQPVLSKDVIDTIVFQQSWQIVWITKDRLGAAATKAERKAAASFQPSLLFAVVTSQAPGDFWCWISWIQRCPRIKKTWVHQSCDRKFILPIFPVN